MAFLLKIVFLLYLYFMYLNLVFLMFKFYVSYYKFSAWLILLPNCLLFKLYTPKIFYLLTWHEICTEFYKHFEQIFAHTVPNSIFHQTFQSNQICPKTAWICPKSAWSCLKAVWMYPKTDWICPINRLYLSKKKCIFPLKAYICPRTA